jgi:hypothetical protein
MVNDKTKPFSQDEIEQLLSVIEASDEDSKKVLSREEIDSAQKSGMEQVLGIVNKILIQEGIDPI